MATKRKKTDPAIKAEIIRRVMAGEIKVPAAAKQYGISSDSQIYGWLQTARKSRSTAVVPTSVISGDELSILRDRNATLEAENADLRARLDHTGDRLDIMQEISVVLGEKIRDIRHG